MLNICSSKILFIEYTGLTLERFKVRERDIFPRLNFLVISSLTTLSTDSKPTGTLTRTSNDRPFTLRACHSHDKLSDCPDESANPVILCKAKLFPSNTSAPP